MSFWLNKHCQLLITLLNMETFHPVIVSPENVTGFPLAESSQSFPSKMEGNVQHSKKRCAKHIFVNLEKEKLIN